MSKPFDQAGLKMLSIAKRIEMTKMILAIRMVMVVMMMDMEMMKKVVAMMLLELMIKIKLENKVVVRITTKEVAKNQSFHTTHRHCD